MYFARKLDWTRDVITPKAWQKELCHCLNPDESRVQQSYLLRWINLQSFTVWRQGRPGTLYSLGSVQNSFRLLTDTGFDPQDHSLLMHSTAWGSHWLEFWSAWLHSYYIFGEQIQWRLVDQSRLCPFRDPGWPALQGSSAAHRDLSHQTFGLVLPSLALSFPLWPQIIDIHSNDRQFSSIDAEVIGGFNISHILQMSIQCGVPTSGRLLQTIQALF